MYTYTSNSFLDLQPYAHLYLYLYVRLSVVFACVREFTIEFGTQIYVCMYIYVSVHIYIAMHDCTCSSFGFIFILAFVFVLEVVPDSGPLRTAIGNSSVRLPCIRQAVFKFPQ